VASSRRRHIAGLVVLAAAPFAAPSSANAYETATVPDTGTITGKVLYSGEVPMKRIIPTKDASTCGAMREEPEVLVGTGHGVEEAVVYLKDVSKGKAWQKRAAPPEIVNRGCKFVPHVQALPIGSIVIVNADPVMHNTHGFLGKTTVFNQALPLKGQRIEKPLKKEGMMRVECDTHGWMLGWIYVAENPYYAVTAADGTFSISSVPPGDYTLVTWQEYTGATERPVTVKPKETVRLTVELQK